MNKLERLQKEINFYNNYFDDTLFIGVVQDKGLSEEFESASYDTEDECIEYIKLFFDTFSEYIDSKFIKKLKKFMKKYYIQDDTFNKIFTE